MDIVLFLIMSWLYSLILSGPFPKCIGNAVKGCLPMPRRIQCLSCLIDTAIFLLSGFVFYNSSFFIYGFCQLISFLEIILKIKKKNPYNSNEFMHVNQWIIGTCIFIFKKCVLQLIIKYILFPWHVAFGWTRHFIYFSLKFFYNIFLLSKTFLENRGTYIYNQLVSCLCDVWIILWYFI